MKNSTVSKPMTSGQRSDIIATFAGFIPAMTSDDAQALIGAKGKWGKEIFRSFELFIRTKTVSYHLDEWTWFYKEVFGLDCDYSQLQAPVSREGFEWFLVADERISTKVAYESFPQRKSTRYIDIDQLLKEGHTSDRDQKDGTYAIWLRNSNGFPDKIHIGKSPDELKQEGVKGITLREQLILERWYEWKTGGYLCVPSTICSGSCCSFGLDVPYVDRMPQGRAEVIWRGHDYSHRNAGCREVIAL